MVGYNFSMENVRKIENVNLGGFSINPIGIGTWKMGGYITPSFSKKRAQEETSAIMYSVSLGQNHIDTAELYGAGKAEKLVAKAVKGADRDSLFIASKLWSHNRKRKSVIPAIKKMLGRLETDYLNLIYIHFPWSKMESYMAGMSDAVEEGLAKGLAVSNFNLEQLEEAQELSRYPILANQVLFNIYNRGVVTNKMLEYCRKNNIMIVAYTPVEPIFTKNRDNTALEEIAEKYQKTMSQIALNWLIVQENVITIPKAVKKSHIDDNIGTLDFRLDKKDIETLDKLGTNSDRTW